MSPTAALELEEEFVVPVDLGIGDGDMQMGARRCCGCYAGACCNLVGGDCRTEE